MVLGNRLVSILLRLGSNMLLVCGSVILTLLQHKGCRVSVINCMSNPLTDLPQAL